jgi:hypothetical protein
VNGKFKEVIGKTKKFPSIFLYRIATVNAEKDARRVCGRSGVNSSH